MGHWYYMPMWYDTASGKQNYAYWLDSLWLLWDVVDELCKMKWVCDCSWSKLWQCGCWSKEPVSQQHILWPHLAPEQPWERYCKMKGHVSHNQITHWQLFQGKRTVAGREHHTKQWRLDVISVLGENAVTMHFPGVFVFFCVLNEYIRELISTQKTPHKHTKKDPSCRQ